jgi:hypothetical protein
MKKIILVLVSILFFSCGTEVPKGSLDLDKVDKVRLISYPSRTFWGMDKKILGSDGKISIDKEFIIDDLFLNKGNQSQLILILKDKEFSEEAAACYEPRHLFVFYDDKGKILGYYEICLECGNGRGSVNLYYLPNFSMEKAEKLKGMFIEIGLKNTGDNSQIVNNKEKNLLSKILNKDN